MTLREKIDCLAEDLDCEIYLIDGLDDALLGTAAISDSQVVAVYDYALCIEVLMKTSGSTYEEALEHFTYNIEGARYPGFPIFLERLDA